jgi:hypothetical protein
MADRSIENRATKDATLPAEVASQMHEATERARAFAAQWFAQRAKMECAVADYHALRSTQQSGRTYVENGGSGA